MRSSRRALAFFNSGWSLGIAIRAGESIHNRSKIHPEAHALFLRVNDLAAFMHRGLIVGLFRLRADFFEKAGAA